MYRTITQVVASVGLTAAIATMSKLVLWSYREQRGSSWVSMIVALPPDAPRPHENAEIIGEIDSESLDPAQAGPARSAPLRKQAVSRLLSGATVEFRGIYMSACACRSEVTLMSGAKLPHCPACGKPVEWSFSRSVWADWPKPERKPPDTRPT